jgi:hypothetical protein
MGWGGSMRNFEEWVKFHDDKASRRCKNSEGRERMHPMSSAPGQEVFVDKEHGVFQFSCDNDNGVGYLTGVVGDILWLEKKFVDILRSRGIKKYVAYSCTNKPQALARLTGTTITRTWFEFEKTFDEEL